MIYIYYDYAGTHTTVLAAAYHLKKLPIDRKLTKEEILNTEDFNKLTTRDFGKIRYRGADVDGNNVYTVGKGVSKVMPAIFKNLSGLLLKKYQGNEKIVFSCTSPTVPFAMTMGGLFSRRLKLDFIGVPLLVSGAMKCCGDIIQLVENTKQVGESTLASVTVLENKKR